jgi:AcrR family transcriptional regulator
MPKGVTKRRKVTVAALLDAALELFTERGFGATSIPEICARAGLTKGAFYSNFADKEALFLALFDRQAAERAQRIRVALADAEAVAQAVTTGEPLPGAAAGVEDRRWFLLSMEFTLHAIRHPQVAALLSEHEAAGRAGLAELITTALESIGRVPVIPVQDLAAMVVAAAEGSTAQALTRQAAGRGSGPGLAAQMIPALVKEFTVPAGPAPGGHDLPPGSHATAGEGN